MDSQCHRHAERDLTEDQKIQLLDILLREFAVSRSRTKYFRDCSDRLSEFELVVTKSARNAHIEHDDDRRYAALRIVHPDPTAQPRFESNAPWDKSALLNIAEGRDQMDTDDELAERQKTRRSISEAYHLICIAFGRGSNFALVCNLRTAIDQQLSVILSDEFMNTITFLNIQTALCHSAFNGFTELCKWFLHDRQISPLWCLECYFGPARVLARCISLVSPLQFAVFARHHDIIRLFIKSGANVNFDCVHGINPLMAAVSYGDITTSKFLLDMGAHPDVLGHYPHRQSALHCAVDGTWKAPLDPDQAGRLVTLMVHHNANVELTDFHGNTPIMTAVHSRCFCGVSTLLLAGASVFSTNTAGKTALLMSRGDKALIALFSMHLLNAPVRAEHTCVLPNGRIWIHTNHPANSFFDAMAEDEAEAEAMAQADAQAAAEGLAMEEARMDVLAAALPDENQDQAEEMSIGTTDTDPYECLSWL